MGIKEWIIPQEKKFFDMLDVQALKVREGVLAMQEMLHNFEEVGKKRANLKQIENEADDLVHKIFSELNKTFITPIDREDISQLASKLDDIMDHVYGAANRLFLFGIESPSPEMLEFSDILVQSMDEIVKALACVRNLSKAEEISKACVEVNRLENRADEILNDAIPKLFLENDLIKVIKYKDIIETLEEATDSCEDVAVLIGNIVMKHS